MRGVAPGRTRRLFRHRPAPRRGITAGSHGVPAIAAIAARPLNLQEIGISEPAVKPPLTIRVHTHGNVAIVANDGGLVAGTALSAGPVLLDRVPQGHTVGLVDIAADAPEQRYGIPIGIALKSISAGSWAPAVG